MGHKRPLCDPWINYPLFASLNPTLLQCASFAVSLVPLLPIIFVHCAPSFVASLCLWTTTVEGPEILVLLALVFGLAHPIPARPVRTRVPLGRGHVMVCGRCVQERGSLVEDVGSPPRALFGL